MKLRTIATALVAALPLSSGLALAQTTKSPPLIRPAAPAAVAPPTVTPASRSRDYGALYVALGASFSAGPGLPMQKRGVPARCGQSALSYPTLTAIRFRVSLHDVSCSGATTENILRGWNELPPQIDAVTSKTRLVTISAGGNDLGYVGGLFGATNCGFPPEPTAAIPGAPPKAPTAGKPFTPCPPARQNSEAEFVRVEKNMREIVARINERAPQAKIVFVTYLTLVPTTLCRATPIVPARADASRALADRIAQITAKVASETGALIARMDEASRTHTPCDVVPWTNGAPPGYNGADGIQWHPNIAGMQATAAEITAVLSKPTSAIPVEIKPTEVSRKPQAPRSLAPRRGTKRAARA